MHIKNKYKTNINNFELQQEQMLLNRDRKFSLNGGHRSLEERNMY